MSLIYIKDLSLRIAERHIFKQVSMQIAAGERIGIIGRNGSGKSTLFQLLLGNILPDSGDIVMHKDTTMQLLQQAVKIDSEYSVYQWLKQGLAEHYQLLEDYRQANQNPEKNATLINQLYSAIETVDGWNLDQKIDDIISRLALPKNKKINQLSGGWLRKVALAKVLLQSPKILLLDEPTNHLDIATIDWLESLLHSFKGAIVLVTHDRYFLQNIARRIIEIDRCQLVNYSVNYRKFLLERQRTIDIENNHNLQLAKRLREEQEWANQGVKARRTRNEGRMRRFVALKQEFENLEKRQRTTQFYIQQAERSGVKVIEAYNINYSIANQSIIANFNIKITRGDKIALIGSNGCGKSTLLKLLIGQLTPTQGTIKLGTNLQMGYYDQVSHGLDDNKSVRDNVSDGRDYIDINGKPRHILGYLKNFLFSPTQAQTKVQSLSGGEKNRVVLAKLLSRPSNVLVLDEPTNDLDLETLEVLEQQLKQYQGTLLLVSHDRDFIDNIVTRSLYFDGTGTITHYAGGYSSMMQQRQQLIDSEHSNKSVPQSKQSVKNNISHKKLSYKLQRELDQIPEKITLLEAEQQQLTHTMQQPSFYAMAYEQKQTILNQSQANQQQIDKLYQRWQQLEHKIQ